jgi:hypothetical protein
MTLISLIHRIFCAADAKHFQRRIDEFDLQITVYRPHQEALLLDNLDLTR